MTIQEAVQSNREVTLNGESSFQYFEAGTGPHKTLVDCSYFVLKDYLDDEPYFSTSIDLYPEDLLSDKWRFVE